MAEATKSSARGGGDWLSNLLPGADESASPEPAASHSSEAGAEDVSQESSEHSEGTSADEAPGLLRRISTLLSPSAPAPANKVATTASAEARERLPAAVAADMQRSRRVKRTNMRQRLQEAVAAGDIEALAGHSGEASSWIEPEGGGNFKVRGATYLADKIKVAVLHARAELLRAWAYPRWEYC